MFDKIMEAVGGDALSQITSQAGVTPEQAKEMLPLAQESLQEGLTSNMGNTEGLLGMFNSAGGGGLMSNGIFGSIKGLFMQKIMTKMGLPSSVAGLAAGAGMGSMIGGISNMLKADGDNDGIDASNIMNVLGGGGAAGMLGGLMGGAGALGGIKDAAAGLMGGATEGAGGALGGLKDAASGLMGGATEGAGGAMDGLKDAAAGLMGGATETGGGMMDNLKDAAGDLLGGATEGEGEEGIADKLKDAAADKLKGLFGK